MDTERTITEIEWLERIFARPDKRPLTSSDLAAANRNHDDRLANVPGFGYGSGMVIAADRNAPNIVWPKERASKIACVPKPILTCEKPLILVRPRIT